MVPAAKAATSLQRAQEQQLQLSIPFLTQHLQRFLLHPKTSWSAWMLPCCPTSTGDSLSAWKQLFQAAAVTLRLQETPNIPHTCQAQPSVTPGLKPARHRASSPLGLCQHQNATYTVFFHRHEGGGGGRWPFCCTPQETKRIQVEHMVLMILERGNLSALSSFLDVSEIARFSLFPFTPVVFFI